MATKKIGFIAKKMQDLDICMMSTQGSRGAINTRPMSNNKDVKYNGESYFFSFTNTRKVKDIKRSGKVTLSFTGDKGMFIIVDGKASIIRDKAVWETHWVPSLNNWFPKGIETPGITLIAVKAEHIKFWDKYKEGDIEIK